MSAALHDRSMATYFRHLSTTSGDGVQAADGDDQSQTAQESVVSQLWWSTTTADDADDDYKDGDDDDGGEQGWLETDSGGQDFGGLPLPVFDVIAEDVTDGEPGFF